MTQPMGAVSTEVKIDAAGTNLTITKATAENRTYDGTNKLSITSVTLDGIQGQDDVSVDYTDLEGTLNSANAGDYTEVTLPQSLELTGSAAGNYTLTQPTGAVSTNVTIERAELTVNGAIATDRPYNGNATVSIIGVELAGIINEDEVSVNCKNLQGNIGSKNVGDYTSITPQTPLELSGDSKDNYNLINPEGSVSTNVSITPAVLTVQGAAAKSRIYDGTNKVEITKVTLTGRIDGDDVSVDCNDLKGILSSADVGNYTDVTLQNNIELKGKDYSNYTLTQPISRIPTNVTITCTHKGTPVASLKDRTDIAEGLVIRKCGIPGCDHEIERFILPRKTVEVELGGNQNIITDPSKCEFRFANTDDKENCKKYFALDSKTGKITTEWNKKNNKKVKIMDSIPIVVKTGGQSYPVNVKIKFPDPKMKVKKKNAGGGYYRFKFKYDVKNAKKVMIRCKNKNIKINKKVFDYYLSSPRSGSDSYIYLHLTKIKEVTFTITAYYGKNNKRSETTEYTVSLSKKKKK